MLKKIILVLVLLAFSNPVNALTAADLKKDEEYVDGLKFYELVKNQLKLQKYEWKTSIISEMKLFDCRASPAFKLDAARYLARTGHNQSL